MALVRRNPQNELADIIPEPSVELHSCRVITRIVSVMFVQTVVKNQRSNFISMALAKMNPQNDLGDIISEPHEKLNSFRRINRIV